MIYPNLKADKTSRQSSQVLSMQLKMVFNAANSDKFCAFHEVGDVRAAALSV